MWVRKHRVAGATSALALLALSLTFSLQSGVETESAEAQSFTAETTAAVSTRALGANADISHQFELPSGDYNFDGLMTGAPPQGDLHDLYFAPGGSGPLLGDIVGTLSSSATLGLTNLNCSSSRAIDFVLMNAVNDNSSGLVTPDSTAPAAGQGPMYPYLQDNGVAQDGSPSAQTTAGNGLPAGVEEYPSFLEDLFETGGTPFYPDVRYFGATVVEGTAMTLNMMIFGPGDLAIAAPPNPLYDMSDSRVGYVAVHVLNDPSVVAPPSPITDSCSPVAADTFLYGQSKANPCQPAGGCPAGGSIIEPCSVNSLNTPPPTCDSLASSGRIRWENPGAGASESGACLPVSGTAECTRLFTAYHYSQRDSDGDGLENNFDACTIVAQTADFDPRTGANDPDDDADSDMLPGGGPSAGCDPTPGVNTGSGNHDADVASNGDPWLNAQDNCPLVPNPDQLESELAEPDNISRPRGGPNTDGIGDTCDSGESLCYDALDFDMDGLVNDGCPGFSGNETGGQCFNSTDDDGDQLVNDGCAASGAPETGAQCTNAINDDLDNRTNDGCPADGPAETLCADNIDQDGDTLVNDGCPTDSSAEDVTCLDAQDNDYDSLVNDGCPTTGSFAEDGCFNAIDDPDEDETTLGFQNDDSVVNDGCPSSALVATGAYYATMTVTPVCFSNSAGDDDDLDGVCDAATRSDVFYPGLTSSSSTPSIPADPNDSNAGLIPESYGLFFPLPVAQSGAVGGITHICNDGLDNDGDTLVDILDTAIVNCRPAIPLAFMTADSDGDGFSDEAEIFMGTDPFSRCGVGSGSPPAPGTSNSWPPDVNDASGTSRDKVNTADIALYIALHAINSTPGGAGTYNRRFDLVPGPAGPAAYINTLELATMTAFVPSMFGVKAFNYIGTDCTPHPVFGE